MLQNLQRSPAHAGPRSSSDRPIPLKGRRDLVVSELEFKGEKGFVVKDPVALKYHRLRPEQYDLLTTLDGEASLEGLRDRLRRAHPTIALRLQDVQSLVADLHKKNLVTGSRPGQARGLAQRDREEKTKKFWQTFRNILFLRLPGVDPEGFLSATMPFVRWLFRPWAVALCVLFVLSGTAALVIQADRFDRDLPGVDQFFSFPNLIYVWVLIGAAKILHELGHGYGCKYFGGECHEIGMMLLVFSPCLYCDVTDSWLLKSKWKRIAIAAAGMYVEIILSAAAVFVWTVSPDPFVRGLAVNLFFVTTVGTVIFNANPLMRFDGYYMMSDFLEIPNLRAKADKLLSDTFGHWCLGIKPKPDPFAPKKGKAWFVLFAVASSLYKWFVLFGITLFLYTVLKPYGLESLGLMMAVVSIGGILFTTGKTVHQKITAPRKEPLSKTRMIVSVVTLLAAVAGGLAVPLPLHVSAPFLVEPAVGETVYVTEPGVLSEVRVEPGERVDAGTVLAVLDSDRLADEAADLEARAEVQRVRADAAKAAGDLLGEELAARQSAALEAELAELAARREQLTLRAPRAGVVLPPPAKPDTPNVTDATAGGRLPGWGDTPLDPENAGAALETGTALCVVAADDRRRALLFVDQADRNDVFVGERVELKFDHRPGTVYESEVERFSPRDLDTVPGAVSNKYGGALATVTDAEGREKVTSLVYQATAPIPEAAGPLRPGLRGSARVDQPDRTAGEWLWRRARRLFLFEL